MVQKELSQAWWFDSHNLARTSPWLTNTLSELDDKTKQMLKMIDQDADSFAQRAEMYYKKRPVLVDMLGDLYRTHRSLAEQLDLLKNGNGTRHTVFGPSSCTQSWSHQAAAAAMGGKGTTGSRSSISLCSDTYDSESEVDDPEQEDMEEELSESEDMMKHSSQSQADQAAQLELMHAEIEMLKEKNAELQKASAENEMLKQKNEELQRVSEENMALKAELAAKDEEKREVIRQLASSFDIVKKENFTLREFIIKNSKNSSSSSSRGFDFKKLTKDLFSAKLFTAHCKATTGPMVAL
ncbi:protein NETWORKED 3A-like [Oryza glaberrima]|uniref:NAB domain-containing protein n=2 Tax=Oryza TaxID=4527 RepID=A0A0D3GUP3_9ORYZ|nr:protein NETWORKED 3A-like [Oryza glaberrima]XP_052160975.1 protein NETWORKED 3A-like [Oryza glaberrima]XP_052160976.1 protein NETWORKED 3A-like [Oryza glaberrima]